MTKPPPGASGRGLGVRWGADRGQANRRWPTGAMRARPGSCPWSALLVLLGLAVLFLVLGVEVRLHPAPAAGAVDGDVVDHGQISLIGRSGPISRTGPKLVVQPRRSSRSSRPASIQPSAYPTTSSLSR